jgi:CRP-like cAMP-binding protein
MSSGRSAAGSSGAHENPDRVEGTEVSAAGPATPGVVATGSVASLAGPDFPDANVPSETLDHASEPADDKIGPHARFGVAGGGGDRSSSSSAAATTVGQRTDISSPSKVSFTARKPPLQKRKAHGAMTDDAEGQRAGDGPRSRPVVPSSSDFTAPSQELDQAFVYRPVRISKEMWHSRDDFGEPNKVDTRVYAENSLGLQNRNMPPGIFTPYGRLRRKWDFYILFLVLYSATVSVFVHSFILVIRINEPWFWIENFIDLSFFIDILLWFRTAYITEDMRLETSRKKIALHYLRTWFAVDTISAFPWDTLAYLIQKDSEPGWLQIPRLLRLFRVLKIMSVLRVLRIKRNITRLEIRFRIKYGYLRMIWLLCFVVLIAHWGACLFYLFGELSGPKAQSWIGKDGVPSSHFGQYMAALYFSTYTIVTVGNGDVTPENTLERAFNICFMLVGAITYAFIISQVRATVIDLSSASTKHRREMDELTDFASTSNLPFDLNFDLRRYFQHRMNYHHPDDHQILLNSMSADLRTKVFSQLYKQSLKASYLLQNVSEKKLDSIYVCVVSGLASPGEVIYMEGDESDCMYTILHGNVQISDSANNYQYMGPGCVFGENELLFNSHRRETATAIDYCDFAKISREAVIAILRRDAKVMRGLLLEETGNLWWKTISRAERSARFWNIAHALRAAARKDGRRLPEHTSIIENGSLINSGTDFRGGDNLLFVIDTTAPDPVSLMADVKFASESSRVSQASGLTVRYSTVQNDDEKFVDQSKFGGEDSSDDDMAVSFSALQTEAPSYVVAADAQLASAMTRAELEKEFMSRGRRVARYKAKLRSRAVTLGN